MKKLFYLLAFVPCLFSCTSARRMALAEKHLYIGEDKRTGYLSIENSRFYGPKEKMDSVRPGTVYKPLFLVPDDIVLIAVNEQYHYRPTDGVAVYKQEKRSRTWAKVEFFPLTQVQAIVSIESGDFIKIIVHPLSHRDPIVLKYRWRSEKPNFVARWIQIVKISRSPKGHGYFYSQYYYG